MLTVSFTDGVFILIEAAKAIFLFSCYDSPFPSTPIRK